MIRSPIQRHDLNKPLDELFAPPPLVMPKRHSLGTLVLAYGAGLLIGAMIIGAIAGMV